MLLAVLVGGLASLPWLAGEAAYLSFLGLYGVVFPMYVVAAAIAGRRGLRRPAGWLVVGVSLGVSPLAWLGFVENRILLLLPVAAVVAIAGWTIGRRLQGHRPTEPVFARFRGGRPATIGHRRSAPDPQETDA